MCTYSAECWILEGYGEKCGWSFPDCGDQRYASAVVRQFGHRTIVYDEAPVGETHDCENTESKIGMDADNPIIFTYTADVRISSTDSDGCLATCAISDDYGYDDDTGEILEGDLPEGCGGSGAPQSVKNDPNGLGPPSMPNFHQDNPEPEPDTIFGVTTFDEEGGTITEWTLDVDSCPLFRKWTWNETTVHTNDEVPTAHDCFSVPGDFDIDWTTTVANSYEVQFSDEITTIELVDFVVPEDSASDTNFTSYDDTGSCAACFELSANELQCRYRSALVRITNTSAATIILSWDVATWPSANDPENPCTDDGSEPSLDPGSATLAPGAHIDIPLDPDFSGPNIVMQVINIACQWAP